MVKVPSSGAASIFLLSTKAARSPIGVAIVSLQADKSSTLAVMIPRSNTFSSRLITPGTMKPHSEISLRPATADDRAFLLRVYASTREEELAPVPWTPEQKNAFLMMQFDAQDQHYRAHYPGATFDVVLHRNEPVGRLYVLRQRAEIRIMDIAILPNARGRGIGTSLLSSILQEAETTRRSVTIHVEKENPALRLYRRLGF